MDAVNESDSSLTKKCLDLCHALAGQGKAIKFSLTIGSTFTFSLDSREGKKTFPTRKKKGPSTLRRNAKRRKDFLKKKSTSQSASASGPTRSQGCRYKAVNVMTVTFSREQGGILSQL